MTRLDSDTDARAISVALFRDIPEERRLSMERFADGLEVALVESDRVSAKSTTVNESRYAQRLGLSAPAGYLTRLIRYPLAAGRVGADIYHVIDQGYAHVAALLPHERTVVTCHDLMLLRAQEGVAGFRGRRTSVIRYRWSTGFLPRVARVVCVSQSTRADVMRLGGVPEERIRVVPPGVERHFRSLPDPERVDLRASIPGLRRDVLLHVSTGHPYKNVEQTVRILTGLSRFRFDPCLVRVGRPLGIEERALARELRVEDRIIELGIVSDARLVEIYNAADVLLFPSHYEGFGWPPLEAMACGTPVVASSAPALVEVVGDAGLIEAPTDTRGFVVAVSAVLECAELRRELREKGLARASAYSWQNTASAYEDIYLEVLANAEQASRKPTRRTMDDASRPDKARGAEGL
jgi:glycosyltransferase involved in cell wall biosynthesis